MPTDDDAALLQYTTFGALFHFRTSLSVDSAVQERVELVRSAGDDDAPTGASVVHMRNALYPRTRQR